MKRLAFQHTYIPFNPRWPHAWRGQASIALLLLSTIFRLQFHYRKPENDWQRVDTACLFNISPKHIRWFHFYGYYAGFRRNMYHLTIWRISFSVMPSKYLSLAGGL